MTARGVVIDTHAWVWWIDGGAGLSPEATSAIDDAARRNAAHLSAISAWEVALLAKKGRLELRHDVAVWIAAATGRAGVRVHALDVDLLVRSVALDGGLPDDPADRMIVATARRLGVPLVTRDRRLHRSADLECVW